MAAISWVSGVSGNWNIAANWTGGAVPGAGDDVSIAASGIYTVTISSADAANSLTLDNVTATLAVNNGGTLAVGSTLAMDFGALKLNTGGVISGGTLSATGGSFQWLGGALDGVTYDGTLTVSAASSHLIVASGGLTVKGAGGSGPGTINLGQSSSGSLGLLIFDDTQTFDNATINMENYAYLGAENTSGESDTLTLGVNVTINQVGAYDRIEGYNRATGDTIINKGTINATYQGAKFLIGPPAGDGVDFTAFDNQGDITVSNGVSMYVNADTVTNQGAINLASGAVVHVSGTTFTNQAAISVGSGDVLRIGDSQIVNAAGATITAGEGSTLSLLGNLTNAGTITVTDGAIDLNSGFVNTGALAISGSMISLSGTFLTAKLAIFENNDNAITINGGTIENSGGTLTLGAGTPLGFLTLGSYGEITGGKIVDTGGGLSIQRARLDGVIYDGDLDVSAPSSDLAITTSLIIHDADGGDGTMNISGDQSLVEFSSTSALNNLTINEIGTDVDVSFFVRQNLKGLTVNLSGASDIFIFAAESKNTNTTFNLTGEGSQIQISNSKSNDNLIFNLTGQNSEIDLSGEIDSATINLGGVQSLIYQGPGGQRGTQVELGPRLIVNQTGALAEIGGVKTKRDSLFNYGAINAGVAGGTFEITASNFANEGVITVSNGETFNIDPSIGFTNLSGSTLTGGTFAVDAGSALSVHKGVVVTDDATIVLSGAGSTFQAQGTSLDSSLTTIGSGGILELLAGRSWSSTNAMTSAGVLGLGGGTFSPASFVSTGVVTGFGVMATTFTNDGALSVDAGQTLSLVGGTLTNLAGGTLTGGTWLVNAGATLQLADNTSIVTLAAVLALNGLGSTVQGFDTATSAQVGLKDSLVAISASGMLELLAGRNFAGDNAISNLGAIQLAGGNFATGALTDAAGSSLTGFGVMASTFLDSGVVDAVGGALAFSGAGDVFNVALGGEEIDFTAGTDLLSSPSSLTAATVALSGGAAVTLGQSLAFGGVFNEGAASLTLAAGVALSLGGAATFGPGAVVKGAGALTLANATAAGLTVAVAVTDSGLIEAESGTLAFTKALSGAGALTIDAGATLEADGAAVRTLTTTFNGAGAVLAMGQAAKFLAAIAGFAVGDTIDLLNTAATGATLQSGGKLVITNGAQTVATLHLLGSKSGETFSVTADGHGGSDITVLNPAGLPPPAAPPTPHALAAAMASLDAGAGAALTASPHADPARLSLLIPRTQSA